LCDLGASSYSAAATSRHQIAFCKMFDAARNDVARAGPGDFRPALDSYHNSYRQ